MATKHEAGERRVREALNQGTKILRLLHDRAEIPLTLSSELLVLINRIFPLPALAVVASKSTQLDQLGSDLWNATTNIIHEEDDDPSSNRKLDREAHNKLLALFRYFAFLLLDAAQHEVTSTSKVLDRLIRILKIALKTTRYCLEKEQLDLAQRALEKCSDYASRVEVRSPVVRLGAPTEDDRSRQDILKRLIAEYYLLRVMHGWKSGRLDVSYHFVSKISVEALALSAELAERAAELYYVASKDEYTRNNLMEASRWAERANEAIEYCSCDLPNNDLVLLRLHILHIQVRVLLADGALEQKNLAWTLTDQVASHSHYRDDVLLYRIRFEILISNPASSIQDVSNLMSDMVSSVRLSESSFKAIMHIIHKARHHDSHCACQALYDLATRCLQPTQLSNEISMCHQDWLEKCIVTFAYFVTSIESSASATILSRFHHLLNTLQSNTMQALTGKATHAVQTLLWKATTSAEAEVGDIICNILRHPLFSNAGDINKARISRKAVMRALDKDNLDAAREAFFQIPESERDDGPSRYLGFKLGLRSQDFDLACESLEVLVKSSETDNRFLLACVLDAQQSRYRRMTVKALQALADVSPPGVNLATLLRCTARLLMGELEDQPEDFDAIIKEIADVLDHAASSVCKQRNNTGDESHVEVQWWAKNSYNVALRLCGDAHPATLWRILQACIKFLSHYHKNVDVSSGNDILRRKLSCQFLVCSTIVVLARAEEDRDNMRACYLECRQAIELFKALRAQLSEQGQDQDLESRTFELLKLDVECVLRLEQWDSIRAALQACLDFEPADRWDTMADLVILIHNRSRSIDVDVACSSQIQDILRRAVNETFQQQRDIVKVARWLRIAFAIGLESSEAQQFSLSLLAEARDIAKKQSEIHEREHYPQSELQWLATTAFNKAVDYLAEGDQATSELWSTGATELAYYNDDGGALHNNLCRTLRMAKETIEQRE